MNAGFAGLLLFGVILSAVVLLLCLLHSVDYLRPRRPWWLWVCKLTTHLLVAAAACVGLVTCLVRLKSSGL